MTGDLASPRGIALGPAGEIYVADSGAASQPGSGRVLRIMADGTTAPILVGAANFTAAPHGETYIYGLSDVAVQADSLLLSDVAVQADSLLFSVGFGATGNGALGVPNRLLRLGPTGALCRCSISIASSRSETLMAAAPAPMRPASPPPPTGPSGSATPAATGSRA